MKLRPTAVCRIRACPGPTGGNVMSRMTSNSGPPVFSKMMPLVMITPLERAFEAQEEAFGVETFHTGIAAEAAARRQYPVAGDHDGKWIATASAAHRAGAAIGATRDVAIRCGLAIGDRLQLVPQPALEGGALRTHRQ